MITTRTILAAALVATPGIALAQGFEGAQVAASVTALGNSGDVDISNYGGGIQFGIGAGISVELDFGLHDWRAISGQSRSMTLHAIYELTPGISAGLYYGEEHPDSGKVSTYGIEGTSEFGSLDVGGYLGHVEDTVDSATALGVDATMNWGSAFAFSAAVDSYSGMIDMQNISLGGEYRFASGPAVFADIGQYSVGGASENYVAIGARVELGRGTTFRDRGPSNILSRY